MLPHTPLQFAFCYFLLAIGCALGAIWNQHKKTMGGWWLRILWVASASFLLLAILIRSTYTDHFRGEGRA